MYDKKCLYQIVLLYSLCDDQGNIKQTKLNLIVISTSDVHDRGEKLLQVLGGLLLPARGLRAQLYRPLPKLSGQESIKN